MNYTIDSKNQKKLFFNARNYNSFDTVSAAALSKVSNRSGSSDLVGVLRPTGYLDNLINNTDTSLINQTLDQIAEDFEPTGALRDYDLDSIAINIADNLKPTSLDETLIGYAQKLGSSWSMNSYYNLRTLNKVVERDFYELSTAIADETGEVGIGGEAPGSYIGIISNPGFDVKYDGATYPAIYPQPKRYFSGFTIELNKSWDGDTELLSNITLSQTRGNYEGPFSVDGDSRLITAHGSPFTRQEPTGDTIDTSTFSPYRYYGDLPNSRSIVANILARKALTPSVTASTYINVTSPRQFSPLQNELPVADYIQVERGSFHESDWIRNINLMLSYETPLAGLQFSSDDTKFHLPLQKIQAYISWNNVTQDQSGVDINTRTQLSSAGAVSSDLTNNHYHLTSRVAIGAKISF